MIDQQGSSTPLSLFGRLLEDRMDQEGWRALVLRYGPVIDRCCRQKGLQEADAQNVTQDVLIRLYRSLGTYEPRMKGGFRRWLHIVVSNVLRDFFRAQGRAERGWGDGEEGFAGPIKRNLDEEIDRELLELAVSRVRLQVSEREWEAFRLRVFEGWSGSAVAQRLGVAPGTVFGYQTRVKAKLTRIIADLLKRELRP